MSWLSNIGAFLYSCVGSLNAIEDRIWYVVLIAYGVHLTLTGASVVGFPIITGAFALLNGSKVHV